MKSFNFIKIVLLLMILVGVVWIMRFLQTPEAQTNTGSSESALGILLGVQDARPINWCENSEGPVQLYPADMESNELPKRLDPKDRARICTAIMEPASLADAQGEYRPVAEVLEEKGNGPILEQNAQGVFRAKGMPFRSTSLAKVVAELR